MSTYRVADGHGVALGSLTVMSPQPQGDPVAPVLRSHGVSGVVHNQGKFAVWRYSHLASVAEYLAVLTLIGLHNADSNDVTIYTRDERFAFTRYNAKAILPQPMVDMRWQEYFPRGIDIYFIKLVAL